MVYDKIVDSAALDKQITAIADAVKTKTVWTLQNNKVVSSLDTNGDYKIPFDDLAWEIVCIDKNSRMTLYPDGLDNGFYGVMAARCAATYHAARSSGNDVFDYNDDGNVFNTAINSRVPGKYSAQVRDKEGRGCLDCSSYIGLVLRGIPYSKSPFVTHREALDRWVPSEEMAYGDEGWEFPVIDKQPATEYRKTGFDGYSSIRGARHQAEFFYKYGYVVYDRDRDGAPTEALKDLVQPGDLIFWSYIDDGGGYDRSRTKTTSNNFRSIHHVGMIAENPANYWQVTGDMGNTENENTVVSTTFYNSVFESISLICRPDYRKGKPLETPLEVNLINYPWLIPSDYELRGVTFTMSGLDGESWKVTGQMTGSNGIATVLKWSENTPIPMSISPGTYTLSMGNPDAVGKGLFLQLGKRVDDSFTEVAKCGDTYEVEFTIDEPTAIFLRIGCNSKEPLDYEVTPTLKRVG